MSNQSPTKRPPGRPRGSRAPDVVRVDQRIALAVTIEMFEQLRREAEMQRVTMAGLIRLYVRQSLTATGVEPVASLAAPSDNSAHEMVAA